MTYSSGMVMRLGFAVQTVLDPDLLIVDEALAVGDAKFQDKCYRKLRALRDLGTSILFVSHDMNAVTSFCDRSILLEKGQVHYVGSPSTAAKNYMKLLYSEEQSVGSCGLVNEQNKVEENKTINHLGLEKAGWEENTNRFGNGLLEILFVEIRDAAGNQVQILESGCRFSIAQVVVAHAHINGLSSGFIIRNSKGLELFGITNKTAEATIPDLRPGEKIRISIDCEMWLAAGEYFVQAANSDNTGIQYDCQFDAIYFTVIGTNKLFTNSMVNLNPKFIVQNVKK
jgi:ABC-type sugar transport system ATPase subunit